MSATVPTLFPKASAFKHKLSCVAWHVQAEAKTRGPQQKKNMEDSRKHVNGGCTRMSSDLAQDSEFDAGASQFISLLYERCELAGITGRLWES